MNIQDSWDYAATGDRWGTSVSNKFMKILPIPSGYVNRAQGGPMNTKFGQL